MKILSGRSKNAGILHSRSNSVVYIWNRTDDDELIEDFRNHCIGTSGIDEDDKNCPWVRG